MRALHDCALEKCLILINSKVPLISHFRRETANEK